MKKMHLRKKHCRVLPKKATPQAIINQVIKLFANEDHGCVAMGLGGGPHRI